MRTRTELAAIWPPTAAVAREAGHTSDTPAGGHPPQVSGLLLPPTDEVRLCEAVNCALWPFRAGRYPVGRRNLQKPRYGSRF